MRTLAWPLAVGILLTPFFAFAVGSPVSKELAKICPQGLQGNPPSRQEFSLDGSDNARIQSYVQKAACANACFDETVTLEITAAFKLVLDTKATSRCSGKSNPTVADAKAAGIGCEFKTQPQITLQLPAPLGSKGPKSRCHAQIGAAVNKALSSVGSGDLAGVQTALTSIDDLGTQAPVVTPIDGATNQAILDAFGADVAAKVTASGNDEAVKAGLEKLRTTGDSTALEDALKKSGVDLNADVKTNIAKLAASRSETDSAPVTEVGPPTSGSTFDTSSGTDLGGDINKAKCAIATIESGSCEGNYLAVGPPTRKGNHAYGKYQVMDFNIPSWTADACGRSYTVEEFRADPVCQETVFEKKFGSYVTQCGSYEGAAAKWFSGSCTPDPGRNDLYTSVSRYLQKFAGVFKNASPLFGAIARAYTGNTGSPFASIFGGASALLGSSMTLDYPNSGGYGGATLGQDYYCITSTSPLTIYTIRAGTPFPSNCYNSPGGSSAQAGIPTFPQQPPPSTGVGSTLTPQNMTNFVVGAVYNTQTYCVTSVQPLSLYNVPAKTPFPPNCHNNAQQQVQPTPTPTPSSAPEPVATLIAQPKEVTRGGAVTVSWSSVGMSPSSQCLVTVESGGSTNTFIAQANEGTKVIPTSATTAPGTWNFTMQCMALSSGTLINRLASVLVK